MNPPQQSVTTIKRQRKKIVPQSGSPIHVDKINPLQEAGEPRRWKAKDILKYHDTLLSILAWPENKDQLRQAKTEMARLISGVMKIITIDKMVEHRLSNSGIAGTELTGCFSYAITRWLVNEFGEDIKIHSSEASTETIKLFFHQLIPSVEYESVTTGELNLIQRIRKIKGRNNNPDIKWLINLFETAPISYKAKEFLFNELKIFVTWKLNHPEFNRSCSGIPQKKYFFQQKLNRVVAIKKIWQSKLPMPVPLSIQQKKHLVNVARASLLFLHRETDPFTFASADGIKLFELKRGISIALYSMEAGHHLSIESYVGYMVFKNGIPVSYGGGWIFGKRCQFGINILEPFRGGESAYIFSQLIRVYHQHFKVNRFIVKPYQFGKNNKEALISGAFWFYYKHGFRPEDASLHKLAENEWTKKAIDKNYRTPISLLKKFTYSNLVLLLSKTSQPVFDASLVSLAVTGFINEKFNGNRTNAIKGTVKKTIKELNVKTLENWDVYEKKAFLQWSLIIQALLDLNKWKIKEKKELLKIIKSKGDNDELKFITLLQSHQKLWQEFITKLS